MKNTFHRIIVAFLFLLSFQLNAQIVESHHFKGLYDYVSPDTLVVLDIDNTLLELVQELGNDQWFNYQLQKYLNQGMTSSAALERALSEWHAVQSISKVKLVEPHTDLVIEDFQKKGLNVMGLTTRGLALASRTIEQLQICNVDLTLGAPTKDEIFFKNGPQYVLFRGGVLFTAATHKGRALFKFLELINFNPKAVVFINDKASHLMEIEESCHEREIPFVGLRYGYADVKVKNFRKDIAEIQFEHFGHILSNEAAEQILIERSVAK